MPLRATRPAARALPANFSVISSQSNRNMLCSPRPSRATERGDFRWRGPMKVFLAALICLLCWAQTGTLASDGTFRSGVDLVSLTVIVTDIRDKFVTGLSQQDFSVFEDGIQQDVSFFAAAHVPLDLAILLDMSSSMSDKMTTVHEAAVGFASHLHEGDRVSVIGIRDSARTLHDLDGDVKGACE